MLTSDKQLWNTTGVILEYSWNRVYRVAVLKPLNPRYFLATDTVSHQLLSGLPR